MSWRVSDWLRSAWIPLTVTAFAATVLVSLLARVPNTLDAPLVPEREGWAGVPVELDVGERAHDRATHRLRLHEASLHWLLQFPELRIRVATYGTRPKLHSAELVIGGTPCAYRTAPGAALENNKLLPLFRSAECGSSSIARSGDLEFVVRTVSDGRVAVWTSAVPEGQRDERFILVRDRAVPAPSSRLAVAGRTVEWLPGDGRSRMALLNYVWQIADGTSWLWIGLAVVLGLLALGLSILPTGEVPSATWSLILRCAVGAFSLATALAVAYALLVPPFQAPDEPDHLLAFARTTGRVSLEKDAADWARLGHLERIRAYPDERFRPADVGRPYPVPWGDYVWAEDVRSRSLTTWALWSWLGRRLPALSVSKTLLAVRLTNALIFGLAVAFSAGLIASLATVRYPQLSCLAFLLVPTLPFFAMHMSEFALLTSAYVLLSSAWLLVFFDTPHNVIAGLLVGAFATLAFLSGRSALPLLGLLAALLAGRSLMGTKDPVAFRHAVGQALAFWTGFGLAVTPLLLGIPDHDFSNVRSAILRGVPRGETLLRSAAVHPLVLLCLVVFVGCFVETVSSQVRGLLVRACARPAQLATRALAWLAAGAIVTVVAASAFLQYPTLATLESRRLPSLGDYTLEVSKVLASSLRVGRPDFLLVTSFWTGFGWLETSPPVVITTALVIATATSLVVLLMHLARTADSRRVLNLLFFAAGSALSVVAYAASSYALRRNLHGRYLVGLYLAALVIAWSPAVLAGARRSASRGVSSTLSALRVPGLVMPCLLLHAYCLAFIISRYF